MYYVYILASKKHGVLYTGITNDLSKRVEQHRSGSNKSFTVKYRAFRLVWFQEFQSRNEAILTEKRIKKRKRVRKIALIEKENKEWRDLLGE